MNELKKLEKEYIEANASHLNAVNHKIKIYETLSPLNGKAKYITCRECKSRLNVEQMKTHILIAVPLSCPVCNSRTALYSTTANSRLEAAEKKYNKSRDKLEKCRNAFEKAKQQFENENPQIKSLQEIRERLEIIYSEQKTPDFIEIKGEIGGDMLCYRVYNDGFTCEK